MCVVCEDDELGLETYWNYEVSGPTPHNNPGVRVHAVLENMSVKHDPVLLHTLAILK